MNRRMPNGTYGGVRGRGREAPAYSIYGKLRITCDNIKDNLKINLATDLHRLNTYKT